jgi:hypothetical protein
VFVESGTLEKMKRASAVYSASIQADSNIPFGSTIKESGVAVKGVVLLRTRTKSSLEGHYERSLPIYKY